MARITDLDTWEVIGNVSHKQAKEMEKEGLIWFCKHACGEYHVCDDKHEEVISKIKDYEKSKTIPRME